MFFMKDYKFYTKISAIYLSIFILLSSFIIFLLLKNQTQTTIENSLNHLTDQTEMLKRVQQKISAVDKNFDEASLIQNIIEGTHTQKSFLSVLNWAGNYVCYPEMFKVGEKPTAKSVFENETIDSNKVYRTFFKTPISLKEIPETSPILELITINGSDFIIAHHINLNEIELQTRQRLWYYIGIFAFMGLALWLLTLWVCRYLSNYFNIKMQFKIEELTTNSKSLEDLNISLEKYQENIKNIGAISEISISNKKDEDIDEEITKERILTYTRNELLPISVNDIAYVYVENTITYIVTKEAKRSTTPDSLDKIYSILDEKVFFKVNRQFIVNIEAIEKITKFENSKLKLQVAPISDLDIVIGKNKVAQFKQWLDL